MGKKIRPTTFGPGVLNPSDPGRSPHLRDGTRRARDPTRRRKQQWWVRVDSTPAVAMAAAGWPLSSSVADLLPASLSLTLLLASLVHPLPPSAPFLLRLLALLIPSPRPSRAQVVVVVLGAAAFFFEHIRKIGCTHS